MLIPDVRPKAYICSSRTSIALAAISRAKPFGCWSRFARQGSPTSQRSMGGDTMKPRSTMIRWRSRTLWWWQYEMISLDRLDEIAERLPAGEFVTQREIASFFGVSPTMARKYFGQGIGFGMWTEETISRGLSLGKRLRSTGKTQAPVAW
jgi:hypothetical protein